MNSTNLTESLLRARRSILGEFESYKNHYNILHLHSRVASALALDKEFVPIIEEDIAKCQNESERRLLEQERDILASGVRWKWFYQDTRSLIRSWSDPYTPQNELFSIVRQYIEVVHKYFEGISIVWEPTITRTCEGCGVKVPEGTRCSKCGDMAAKSEAEPVKEKRNAAGSIDNFMRCIRSISVSKCEPLPSTVAASLDEFAKKVGMYTGEEIRSMPLDEVGHRGPYSIADLIEMLKATGHTAYYPEKWWVAKNYWEWEPQRISPSVEEEINRDCAAVFAMHAEEFKGGGSINREWLALRILLNHRSKLTQPLLLRDFDIIKTPSTLEGYESRWNYFCSKYESWRNCPIYGSWEIDGR
jgi:hypothetical protein